MIIFNHNFRQKIGYTSLENPSSNYKNERPRFAEPDTLCEVSTYLYTLYCDEHLICNFFSSQFDTYSFIYLLLLSFDFSGQRHSDMRQMSEDHKSSSSF